MRHFLAYGNSDQASFRDPEVKHALDYMMVPGTIAAYYPDATAAFVLSSGIKYAIDPRTPLFQELISQPRPSHFELASWLGEPVHQRMQAHQAAATIRFPSDFYTDDVVTALVEAIVEAQRRYGGRAPQLVKKLERYRLLAEKAAPGEQVTNIPAGQSGPRPEFVLAPYFFTSSEQDPWFKVNKAIWQACRDLDPASISPVVAVMKRGLLERVMQQVPKGFSKTVFFWINGLDERRANEADLRQLALTIKSLSTGRQLINLYGSFFSIILGRHGLWGMSNGLGYSEARNWPELGATGAAPARYYLRGLHMYLSDGTAQLIIDRAPEFACDCPVCSGRRVVGMGYHQLKKHFALSRQWERSLVDSLDDDELIQHLKDSRSSMRKVAKTMPSSLVPDTNFLDRWAAALR
jgi:hypothetical protein